jgi:ADP-dependent NAD(P)H-hydrate dehydratase
MSGKPTALTRAELQKHPLPASQAEDKDDRGRILVVAGCKEVPGAALLSGLAAMRTGAGKLQIVTSSGAATALGVSMPEARIVAVAEGRDGGIARSAVGAIGAVARDVDAVVAGPGLAPGKANWRLAAALCDANAPLVLDAELLRVLPECRELVAAAVEPILLPHEGELAALLGCSEAQVERDPLAAGRQCARRYAALTLVKGRRSHVVMPDGRAWLYTGGSPGLAVSGSGDVLAGIVGGLRARGADALTALLWGVWLHGEAGSKLGKACGHVGFLARELPGEIPSILAAQDSARPR